MFHSTPRDSAFARLNPLVKVAMLVATAITVFFIADIAILAVLLIVIVAGIRLYRIEFGRALLVVKLYILGLPMLFALFVLSFLWREPTLTEGFMRGFAEGLRYSLRLLTLILVNFAVVLSTDPREIITALKTLRMPGIISQILAHVITLLPRLVEELRAVVEAQRARGMQWKRMWRPSNWLPVALPVIIAAMRYSEQTAISLELRGGMKRENAQLAPFTVSDWIVSTACAVIAGACVVRYYWGGGS